MPPLENAALGVGLYRLPLEPGLLKGEILKCCSKWGLWSMHTLPAYGSYLQCVETCILGNRHLSPSPAHIIVSQCDYLN